MRARMPHASMKKGAARMALDREYFDAINIELVKKKYYNANKVNAVLEDIRAQATALEEENERLRAQLRILNGQKEEIGEAVLSAQQIYRDIVSRANDRADEIIADAERRRGELERANDSVQEYAVRRVESCFSMLREQQLAAIEAINAEWQDFLCGLYSHEDAIEAEAEALPADIEEKLAAIAGGLKGLDG